MFESLLSILVSTALLVVLALRDPKRLRNQPRTAERGGSSQTLPASIRRICGWLVLLPGAILAAIGHWWAFLIWLGATPAIGWLLAQTLAGRETPSHASIADG